MKCVFYEFAGITTPRKNIFRSFMDNTQKMLEELEQQPENNPDNQP
jgi:hypothetical protein